jgi:hypothetical protein
VASERTGRAGQVASDSLPFAAWLRCDRIARFSQDSLYLPATASRLLVRREPCVLESNSESVWSAVAWLANGSAALVCVALGQQTLGQAAEPPGHFPELQRPGYSKGTVTGSCIVRARASSRALAAAAA